MPTLPLSLPGLPKLLGEMAKKHCRTPDQEATVALRRYVAEGGSAQRLPDDLLAEAHRSADVDGPKEVDLPQDVCVPLWKLAEQHERSPVGEAAWGILWYIDKERSAAGTGENNGARVRPAKEANQALQ
jgi:hypothetical protein